MPITITRQIGLRHANATDDVAAAVVLLMPHSRGILLYTTSTTTLHILYCRYAAVAAALCLNNTFSPSHFVLMARRGSGDFSASSFSTTTTPTPPERRYMNMVPVLRARVRYKNTYTYYGRYVSLPRPGKTRRVRSPFAFYVSNARSLIRFNRSNIYRRVTLQGGHHFWDGVVQSARRSTTTTTEERR